ncbi:MAG: FHA domain-containing protein [Myxococcota bacterium]|nr:FHA domain-containing protein [Myxococcota bacterium]
MSNLSNAPSTIPSPLRPFQPISTKLSLAALVQAARESKNVSEFVDKCPGLYFVRMGLVGGYLTHSDSALADNTCEFDLSNDGPLFRPNSDAESGDAFQVPPQAFASSKITVGRAPFAYIQLRDSSVSGRHAEISVQSPKVILIRDLLSKNGTRLNHKLLPRLHATPLNCGDLVSFGRLSLQFYRPESLYPVLKLLTR